MKLILHQRYRHLLTGRTATLLDIAGADALICDGRQIRRTPLWMIRTFWTIDTQEAAA